MTMVITKPTANLTSHLLDPLPNRIASLIYACSKENIIQVVKIDSISQEISSHHLLPQPKMHTLPGDQQPPFVTTAKDAHSPRRSAATICYHSQRCTLSPEISSHHLLPQPKMHTLPGDQQPPFDICYHSQR